MEFKKCTRCCNFYITEGNVCPRCTAKDNMEFSTFKTYIKENGLIGSIDTISGKTGISEKNISRFLTYDGIKEGISPININNKNGKTML